MNPAEDPSLRHLLAHLAHTAAVARRRVYELGGKTTDEALVALAFRVARSADDEARLAKPTGPVVDLARERERRGRAPASLNYVLALLTDDAARRIVAHAVREHGEANDATKATVMATAIALGLEALESQTPVA